MCRTDSQFRFDIRGWQYYANSYSDILHSNYKSINIISSEAFAFDTADLIAHYKKHFSVKIICYFRNFYSFFSSLSKQATRESLRRDLFEFNSTEKINSHILADIETYVSEFGLENCIFKNYDEIRKKNILLEDFMQTVGIPSDQDFIYAKDDNITPSDAAIMFLYQLSFLPVSYASAMHIRNDVVNLDLSAYKDFRCTLLQPSTFELNEKIVQAIRRQGELLQDPDWFDYSMAQREKYAAIENHDLPAEAQQDIFAQLSEESRKAIIAAYPKAAAAKGYEPILPSMAKIPATYHDMFVKLREGFIVNHKTKLQYAVDIQQRELHAAELAESRTAYLRQKGSWNRELMRFAKNGLAAVFSKKEREMLGIRCSGMFDAPWYLSCNPDVAAAGIDPVAHYIFHGAPEGRNPAPWFDTGLYLQNNPDVAQSGLNPFYHYLRYGAKEGRLPA